jgi:FkbM family methyltransferase
MSQYDIDKFVFDFYQGHKGVFLETGSSHPVDQSNTYRLEQNGWSGMLVEPRQDHNTDYKIIRPNSIVENYALVSKNFEGDSVKSHMHEAGHMYNISGIHIGDGHSIDNLVEWPVTTLDKLLRKHQMKTIDFFSLDVEGYEHEVIEGIDFEYVKFGVIVIETHPYEWNGKTSDFSYLNGHGYKFYQNLSNNHQVWINDVLPKTEGIKYFSNL